MKQHLSFRENRTFTIVQFTDLHWKDGRSEDLRTRRMMQSIIELEQPDLVVFTGDVIYTGPVEPGNKACEHPDQAFRDAVSVVEEGGVPWAFVFGNHDAEQRITQTELMQVVQEHAYSVTEEGPRDIAGLGNYTLEIAGADGLPAAVLYLLDSGSYSTVESIPGYGWIQQSQLRWLMDESTRVNPGRSRGDKLPALAFLHIPIPEYQTMWDTQTCYGHKFEPVCAAQVNSGLFAALLEMGDVMGTFCGHDHVNDFHGQYHGIHLCYGRSSGHSTYGRDGMLRGGRVIQLREGERTFDTWLRLEDGSVVKEQPEHHPEVH
ncbi:metallophosphoesterase family protein [Paenibacillus silvae]|uniref:metallophosphoesterase family protein n=1 Tax=Paenibacillus silvae TaxID=1325358 RepID=UPI0020054C7C|nr:metallophosphoesterase family protein [Paenibacillus silvae]MCK6074553.1 metallophosphoesterase family protein [Paenibacillus silvae]MCK6147971.1 metallophosphoesterase family protein [Paenibacillus silvae]MCK6266269.1 metallophosphoesterase family protein [Paenibacillus silvae]